MKTFISTLALVAALGFAAPAFAQEHMIGGKAIPAAEVASYQAACDALRLGGGAEGSNLSNTDTASTTETKPGSGTVGGDNADLPTVTIEQCDEGAFVASAAPVEGEMMMGGMVVPADQMEAATARCTELRAAAPAAPADSSLGTTKDAASTETKPGSGTVGPDVSFDLASMTVEMCDEAGIATAM